MDTDPIQILERAGVRPTSNRILVLRTLLSAESPVGLVEIEAVLCTLERSSILRVLNVFVDNDIVHMMEDGRGVSKYEVCHNAASCTIDDMHPHFYCDMCNKVYCFDDIEIPHIGIPDKFHVRSVNFMLKGVCPECAAK